MAYLLNVPATQFPIQGSMMPATGKNKYIFVFAQVARGLLH